MEALLCLIKRMNSQKMNVNESENMLIQLVFTLLRNEIIVIYLTSSCVIWAFFGMSGPV
jgi:hypothetical protein